MNIVMTGFEPFGGSAVNASWEAVREVPGVRAVLLPVSFRRAAQTVRELAGEMPDAILCVGEAGGRSAVSFERVAVNLMDARIPDNDGFQPVDEPLCPGKREAMFSTLPTRRMMEAVRALGIPAELSYTAGTYVCNAVFYSLMDEIRALGAPVLGGFIHVPAKGIEIPLLRTALKTAAECLCP